MRVGVRAFVVAAVLCAGRADAQDKAPAPTLQLQPTQGKQIGFKVRFESSSEATITGGAAEPARRATWEMLLSVEIGPADASGVLPATLRIARISGSAARLGLGTLSFDSESPLLEDSMTRVAAFKFTALAGTRFRVLTTPEGSASKVEGIAAARTLAAARIGEDGNSDSSWISEDSVRALFSSLLGPAPLPKNALAAKASWTDTDRLQLNSWDTTYEITRSVQVAAEKDVGRATGKGSVKLGFTTNVALMPLQMCKDLRSGVTSDWTYSLADGLPVAGSDSISMEGTLPAGAQSIAATHTAAFRVTRLASPPPPAVRPLSGAKDAAEREQRQSAAATAEQQEHRRLRERLGTRGAWAVSPNGKLVAAGTPSCDVEVWEADGTMPVAVLKGHTTLVTSVALSDAGETVYACAEDGTLRGWNLKSGKQTLLSGKPNETVSMGGHEISAAHRSVSVSPDGNYRAVVHVALSVFDRRQRKWMKPGPVALFPREVHFLADSRRALILTTKGIELYDLQAQPVAGGASSEPRLEPVWERMQSLLPGLGKDSDGFGSGYPAAVAVLERPSVVVTLVMPDALDQREGQWRLRAWSLLNGSRLWDIPTTARDLAPTPAGLSIVTLEPTVIRLLSPKDGRLIRTIARPAAPRVANIFTPDGSAWFDADGDGNLVRVPLLPPTQPAPGTPPK